MSTTAREYMSFIIGSLQSSTESPIVIATKLKLVSEILKLDPRELAKLYKDLTVSGIAVAETILKMELGDGKKSW